MKALALLVAVSLLLASAPAFAAEPGPPDAAEALTREFPFTPVSAGDPVPYHGILLADDDFFLLLEFQDVARRAAEKIVHLQAEHATAMRLVNDKLVSATLAYEACKADVPPLPEPPSWYESPFLWGVVGVAVGVTVGVVVAQ